MADFIQTRRVALCSLPRALASSARARSGSCVSNSSLKADSQNYSLSGLAANASDRMRRASATSPASHFSLAAISHSTSACAHARGFCHQDGAASAPRPSKHAGCCLVNPATTLCQPDSR